jgi:hypothetical protein
MTPEEKDAEIARLNTELKITVAVCNENLDLKKLITELAEALECHNLDHLQDDLIQRAREETK